MAKIIGGHYFQERNKEAAYLSHQWNRNKGNTLFNFYKNPSYAKQRAFNNYCRKICYDCGGYGLSVVSGNTYNFCASFVIFDQENGNIQYVCKITPCNLYIAPYLTECEM